MIDFEPFPILLDKFYTVLAYIVGISVAVAILTIIAIKVFAHIEDKKWRSGA